MLDRDDVPVMWVRPAGPILSVNGRPVTVEHRGRSSVRTDSQRFMDETLVWLRETNERLDRMRRGG